MSIKKFPKNVKTGNKRKYKFINVGIIIGSLTFSTIIIKKYKKKDEGFYQ
jgi:hypothetical protein